MWTDRPADHPTSLRATLRASTHEQHLRLEARLDLLDAALPLPRYRRLLEALHGYHAPLERRLDREVRAQGIGIELRPRLALLTRDLAALGLTPETIALLPQCEALPRLDSVARVAGCLYVLEGSRLGGQVIARTLRARLGLEASSGAAFYASEGEDTGARWRAVLAWLEEVTGTGDARDELVSAARQTFSTLEGWAASCGVLR